jgi:hypothetical protein
MKIRRITINRRKKSFDVALGRARYSIAFARLDPRPTAEDPVEEAHVDPALAREGFVYRLASGSEGTVLADQVLDYNADPGYLRRMLLHRLTLEARDRLTASGISKREAIRRLGTSPAQLYRLLDTTNQRKTVDQMLRLLQVLDCEIELVVRSRRVS